MLFVVIGLWICTPGEGVAHTLDLRFPTAPVRADTLALNTWAYHSGDDPAYADPSFDDSGWEIVDSRFFPSQLPESGWAGFGWFRIRLLIPPVLRDRPVALTIYHAGASQFFLNGELQFELGTVGTLPSQEVVHWESAVASPYRGPDGHRRSAYLFFRKTEDHYHRAERVRPG